MSTNTHHLRINEPDVTADFSDEDVVLINLSTGFYYRAEGASFAAIKALIDPSATHPIEVASVSAAEVERFARSLIDKHLLVGSVGDCSFTGANGAEVRLSIEEHGDLEDLLGLDPVHDVEPLEGWPVRAPDVQDP